MGCDCLIIRGKLRMPLSISDSKNVDNISNGTNKSRGGIVWVTGKFILVGHIEFMVHIQDYIPGKKMKT